MSVEAKLKKVLRTAEKALGARRKGIKTSPLEVAIHSALAPYNNDDQVRKSMQALLSEFVDWNEVRVSSWKEIGHVLESSGLKGAGDKALSMRKLLREVFEKYNKITLDSLLSGSVEETRRTLQSMGDFPDRSAGAVLLLNLGFDTLYVTPALLRISKRVGLIREDSLAKGTKALLRNIPRKDHFRYQQHLSFLADSLCLPSVTLCDRCPLNAACDRGIDTLTRAKKAKEAKKVKKAKKAEKAEKVKKAKKAEKAEKAKKASKARAGAKKKGRVAKTKKKTVPSRPKAVKKKAAPKKTKAKKKPAKKKSRKPSPSAARREGEKAKPKKAKKKR